LQNRLRAHEIDTDRPVLDLPDRDVAGQEQADLRLGLDGPMGERRLAGAEDAAGAVLDVQLGLEGRLDMSVSTPKSSSLSAAVIRATASSNGGATRVAKPYMACSLLALAWISSHFRPLRTGDAGSGLRPSAFCDAHPVPVAPLLTESAPSPVQA
jgi:hypothetical protein